MSLPYQEVYQTLASPESFLCLDSSCSTSQEVNTLNRADSEATQTMKLSSVINEQIYLEDQVICR